jgi:hypothetical protein
MVRTYLDMDEILAIAIDIEKVLGEIGIFFYEPLQEAREEELALGETNTNKHFQAMNDTLVNYFGRGISGRISHNLRGVSTI